MPPLTGVCEPYGPRVTWSCIAATTAQVTLALPSLHTPVKGRAWRHRLSPLEGLSEPSALSSALPQAPRDARRRLAALSALPRRSSGKPVDINTLASQPLRAPQTEKRPTRRAHPTRQELATTTRNPNHRPPAATSTTTATAICWTRHLTQNAPPLTACH